ncbi:MAG TPA: SIMPL domain-containing protein [Terriglobales bacterium]|nr:SIMPL domain-containing protein [Terriglobales bacterium]
MKSALFIAVVFALLTLPSSAQSPTVTTMPNTIYVGADGKFETAPDTALLQFNISAQGNTAKEAEGEAEKQAETTRQILRANGIDPKQAEIGFYSVNPRYDYRDAKQKLIGYTVTTSATLKLKDFTKIGPVTQQLADASLGQSQSLSYMLDLPDEAKRKAVADAYKRARGSAEALALASGRTLGELSYASVDTQENIRVFAPVAHRAMAMGPAAQTPSPTEEFTPQQVTVTAHVNAVFMLK